MNKIYLLPLMLLFFASCSVDDSAELLNQQTVADTTVTLDAESRIAAAQAASLSDCFKGLAAHINLDVSAGLNNPVIDFIADAPITANPNWSYLVKVEVQQLSDCEDFSSTTGQAIIFANNTVYTNIYASHPEVSVAPSQLPSCYKWRITLERTGKLGSPCKSYSQWYDAPLF